MQWNEHLPVADAWTPWKRGEETLRKPLLVSCRFAQAWIVSRTEAETRFNARSLADGLRHWNPA